MEKLQQLLQQQQQSMFQKQLPGQQVMQNQLSGLQNYQNSNNSAEQHFGDNEENEEDESLQEFLQPQSQQQQSSDPLQEQIQHMKKKLQEQISLSNAKPEQQQSKKPEFSLRQQPPPPQLQESPSLSNRSQRQAASEVKTSLQQVEPFDRKFRQSWRNYPENFTNKEMKKATKLLENDISSQGDDNDEDDDMTEDDIYRLHEELENVRLQNNEMKAALNEARTIIDQQQNQLTEFRRCAAQYQTDTEAFKMKSMFLLSNTQTRDEQVATLIGACERLEAEIEALTWQLDQAKQSLDLKTQECDFLNEQLDEIQLTGGSGSNNNHHNNDDSSINNNMNKQNHVNGENGDKKKTETDQLRSTLSTDYRSFIGNSQVAQMNTLSTGSNMNGANDLNVQVELQKLQEEVIVYQKKEKEWEKVREELLKRQKSLEEEKKQQDLVIGRLASEQATKIQEESLENGDDNEMPAEIVATLNNLHEERTTWKLYASSLVRSFVENCEEFIRKTPYNEPYFESDGERRWYTYSMYLLENLLNVAPYLLSRSDLDLLKRTSNPRSTQRMNRYNTGYSTVERSYEPQLLTALDFPLSASQTQINNSNAGQLPTSEFVQVPLTQQTRSLQQHFGQEPQLFSQVPNSATTVAQNLTQKNMSQRAARAATKPIADLYRKKRQK